MKLETRADIYRQKAAHSTGPATPAGKRRASLNALRHGLTGQTVVLPEDDMAAYQNASREFYAELKPKGILERKAVQTIADTHWRLDRIRAMENSLFSLGFSDKSERVATEDPTIHCALAQAKFVESQSEVLVPLTLSEQRLTRTLVQAKTELKQLQQERRQAEKEALEDAQLICKMKQAMGQPWKPEDAGFEFSNEKLFASTHRSLLSQQALDYRVHGSLPQNSRPSAPSASMRG